MSRLSALFSRENEHTNIVPPSGITAQLTVLAAAAMAFLAVFAVAFSLATGRLAERWGSELAQSSTVRISAPDDQISAQIERTLEVLNTTPGVASARLLSEAEEQALLEPWLGPDLPLERLNLPVLIEVLEEGRGYDGEELRLRLTAEAPGAVLDDHTRWRKPLISAANSLRAVAVTSLLLMGLVTAAIITLAANASLAANEQIILTLRHVGATDSYIASAFVNRFTRRGLGGAIIGSGVGAVVLALLPDMQNGFLTGIGLSGLQWGFVALIPILAAVVSYVATKRAATKTLMGMM